ncbi:MAG: cell division protein FtsA [Armatimonadota bacterium]|nr:cell division protein FtsA [Armatimonadota bacterium]MDR7449677.1 cell division protein FtsA [Armatimonadota bacterium]MDR7460647.1 cell division protein FtsA [Armatimonadota bacterium]MDR7480716.1 cell division protein FtsA [Armatimonadota bacterium]MDR7489030.1 cell division protein FtsA [Armatimonadota bacterium]
MPKKGLVVGLDIGTTKVCAVAGEVDDDGEVHIVGVGTSPSSGLRKGVVVDLEATVRAIEEAVERAERMAGQRVPSAFVSVSGEHITSTRSRGVVAVARGDHEIEPADVARVIEAARMNALPPSDRELIHLLPRDFVVDGHEGVRNPVGMYGARLEVEAVIVTGLSTMLANLVKCVQEAGLEVEEVVLEPLASAEAVLTPAERDLGAVVADIGGGTTSLAVFVGGALAYTAILPVGGHHLTSDIAVGLRTPLEEAEKLKVRAGAATPQMTAEGELIEVFNIGDRQPRILPRRFLAEIIEPRLAEMMGMVRAQLRRSGYGHLVPAGVVLTGGTALLQGLAAYASERLELPARTGIPEGVTGVTDAVRSPAASAGVGLVLYGSRDRSGLRALRHGNGARGAMARVRGWVRTVLQGT